MSEHAEQQQEFYNKEFKKISSAKMDDNIRQFYFEKLQSILSKNIDTTQKISALEIGVGSGILMNQMKKEYDHWSFQGIDISEKNIEEAKQKGLDVFVADACKLDIETKYDLIYGTAVLHHLESPTKFFEAAAKRLNPGGVLLIGAEPVCYAWFYIWYHKMRGSWDIEKGMLNIVPKNIKQDLSRLFQFHHLYVHGNPFAYAIKPVGQMWNALQFSKIPGLNDIYIFARK